MPVPLLVYAGMYAVKLRSEALRGNVKREGSVR